MLEPLVDWVPDGKAARLNAEELPAGGFAFEYCCGRSFVVDNLVIERFPKPAADEDPARAEFQKQLQVRRKELDQAAKRVAELAQDQPGKIAWASDLANSSHPVHLLKRGNYAEPGDVMEPAPLSIFAGADEKLQVRPPSASGAVTTGRRLAWADWVTQPDSRQAALLARVHVNRIWQHHFGTGIVATPENLGISGAAPSHPELLDWLADQFVRSGWSTKAVHRLILNSVAYRQSSRATEAGLKADPDNRLLWRYPPLRLDAEALRDGLLAVSGELDRTAGGPYIPTARDANGEVLVAESEAGARRRSIYLKQQRTQVLSFLSVFDAPSIVFNCTRRTRTTMPLQSLTLMNSDFVRGRAAAFADRLARERPDEGSRVALAYESALARTASQDEAAAARAFIDSQTNEYAGRDDARRTAWVDFCHALLVSNEFLYLN